MGRLRRRWGLVRTRRVSEGIVGIKICFEKVDGAESELYEFSVY